MARESPGFAETPPGLYRGQIDGLLTIQGFSAPPALPQEATNTPSRGADRTRADERNRNDFRS